MKRNTNHKARKLGTWSFGLSAVAIAVVILLNLLLGKLPTSIAQPDISNQGLYNISDTTTELLAGLDKDIDMTLVAQPDNLDDRVVKFLQVYAGLSDRIHYTFVDITEDPNALENYETTANSIVIRCEETGKTTTVYCAGFQGYTDAIITYDPTAYTQYQQLRELYFDGEGQLTAAVNYVTSDISKTVYTLTGHGETELGDSLAGMIRKAGLTLSEDALYLLFADRIPEDCDLLIIDDLGTEMTNQFTQSVLYQVVNTRLMEDKPVIISTNLNDQGLRQRYTPAIASRLLGAYQNCQFLGNDIRQLHR